MDINLEGGREGIEVARWLRTVCDAPVIFISGYTDRDTVERIHKRLPRCYPSRSMVNALLTP
jgi:DNA-binding NarL/FixJ family response regulator